MPAHQPIAPLAGVRILSLSLNLPGPAALMRCRQMGAECAKLEPPPQPGHASSDPMGIYCPEAYATMHAGVRVLHTNLKVTEGQALVAERRGLRPGTSRQAAKRRTAAARPRA